MLPGGIGAGVGEFADLFGMNLDQTGRMFITDTGNSRIQVFDGESWGLFAGDGTPGSEPGQFSRPRGVGLIPPAISTDSR